MRQAWAELMFTAEDQAAKRSDAAMKKVLSHTLEDGTPTTSFQTLMAELQTFVRNTCRTPSATQKALTFEVTTIPNEKQKRAIELISQFKP
jgi:hypothetical protein